MTVTFDVSSAGGLSALACAIASLCGMLVWIAHARRWRLRTAHRAVDVRRHTRWAAQFLTLAFVLRGVWFVDYASSIFGSDCAYHCGHIVISLCNRAATALMFAGLSCIISAWGRMASPEQASSRAPLLHSKHADGLACGGDGLEDEFDVRSGDGPQDDETRRALAGGPLSGRFTAMCAVALSVWIALLQLAALVVRFFFRLSDRQLERFENVDACVTAFFSLMLAAGMVLQALRLFRALVAFESPVLRRLRWGLCGIALPCSALLLLRAGLFLYRPITGRLLDGTLGSVMYPWFFYTAPELLCGLLVLLPTVPRPVRLERGAWAGPEEGDGDDGNVGTEVTPIVYSA